MPKTKGISQRQLSVVDMEGGNFHTNKYGGICQVKCCNNPLGATSLPLMCWTVQINTICLFVEGAGNQCKYRVHFADLFSLHSCCLWDRGWWYAQNNERGGKQPQVKAWREKALGEKERREVREIFTEKLWQLLLDRLRFSFSSVSSSQLLTLPCFDLRWELCSQG